MKFLSPSWLMVLSHLLLLFLLRNYQTNTNIRKGKWQKNWIKISRSSGSSSWVVAPGAAASLLTAAAVCCLAHCGSVELVDKNIGTKNGFLKNIVNILWDPQSDVRALRHFSMKYCFDASSLAPCRRLLQPMECGSEHNPLDTQSPAFMAPT